MSRNIVVICLDSVRKDYFERYARRLTRLSDTSFEQCRAAAPWSLPSHGSIFTGELPHQHGLHQQSAVLDDRDFSYFEISDTFFANLNHYTSICVSANPLAGSEFGIDVLFDRCIDIAPQNRFSKGIDLRSIETQSEGVKKYYDYVQEFLTHDHPIRSFENGLYFKMKSICDDLPVANPFDDGVTALLEEAKSEITASEEPFFLFTNIMDAHGPMSNIRGYDQSFYSGSNTWSTTEFSNAYINARGSDGYEDQFRKWREIYAASIDYLDRKVSEFITTIQETSEKETIFIITSDHGENLGHAEEDHMVGHNSNLSEALLHVPLYLVNPPEESEAETNAYTSHLELGVLIEGLIENQVPDISREKVAAEFVGGFYPRFRRTAPELDEQEQRYLDRMQRCAYSGSSKYLWTSFDESIEYEIDEQRPSSQQKIDEDIDIPDWVKSEFDILIDEVKMKMTSNGAYDVDEDTRKRLKELGYL